MERTCRPSRPVCIPGTAQAFRCRPRGSAGWLSIRLTGQKEGEVGGKLSAGWSPLRALQPHNESADVSNPLTPARVALLATACPTWATSHRRCASPWRPIRPRVSRGDCLRGSFTFSARHPQTARSYPGPLDAIPRHPAIPRTQHHAGTFQRSTRQLCFRTQCVPRGASVSTLPVHSE